MTENGDDKKERITKMKRFTAIWAGQMVSLLGTSMTQFALMIWVWMHTQAATPVALMAFFSFVPMIFMSPVAGALVDRWDRKKTMLISDIAGCAGSAAVLILVAGGFLQVWHFYVLGFCLGILGAFAWPAWSSAITMIVDKRDFARADSMMGINEAVSMIFGPAMGAVLLFTIGLEGILFFDICSFLFAIITILAVHIPNPPLTDTGKGVRGILRDSIYGFRYISARKPLLGLTLVFFSFNLISQFGMLVLGPMILARTDNNATTLGLMMSMLGIGGLVGGISMAFWGGPKRRINGLLGGMALSFIISIVVIPTNVYIWAIGSFAIALTIPISNGCSQAIWQTKTDPGVQGRVFGARRFIAQASSGIGMVVVGPLADRFFTPGMDVGGSLTGTFGWLITPGPGAGMALMVCICFALLSVVAVIGYAIPVIRNVEDLIPDFNGKKPDEKTNGKNEPPEKNNTEEPIAQVVEKNQKELPENVVDKKPKNLEKTVQPASVIQ